MKRKELMAAELPGVDTELPLAVFSVRLGAVEQARIAAIAATLGKSARCAGTPKRWSQSDVIRYAIARTFAECQRSKHFQGKGGAR